MIEKPRNSPNFSVNNDMATAATAETLPANFDFSQEDAEYVVEKPKELDIYSVVYVGDILTLRQKRSTMFRLGGKIFPMPDFYTVPNSIVPRCGITRLKRGMRGVHKNLIDPKTYDNWIQSYTLKHHWNPVTARFEDLQVGTSGASAPLLFKPIKPVNEIGRIADNQSGVVALGPECDIKSGANITEAQVFYFPNWLEILQGKAFLPETLRELQDHIQDRRDKALSSSLRAIGDAYLQSCSDFFDWGKAYVDYQMSAIKETEKFPGGVRYDEVAERLFRMLGLTREDKLVQGFAANQATSEASNKAMAEAITMLANNQGESSKWMQNAIQVMAQIAAGRVIEIPVEEQPPAPATVEEAQAEVARANDDDGFTDMTPAVIEEAVDLDVDDDDVDAVIGEYMAKVDPAATAEEEE